MAIKIFIDQGHNPTGRHNAGAVGQGLFEQDITYQVGVYLADLLRKDPRFEVRLSRNTPTEALGTTNSSSLQARVNAANAWGADYFISIHANASTNPQANGSEVYVYSANENNPAYVMGNDILNSIVDIVGTKNNGMHENKSLYVLRRTKMPALLVELAYITNAGDAEKLKNNQYDFANAIYLGILEYFGYQPI